MAALNEGFGATIHPVCTAQTPRMRGANCKRANEMTDKSVYDKNKRKNSSK